MPLAISMQGVAPCPQHLHGAGRRPLVSSTTRRPRLTTCASHHAADAAQPAAQDSSPTCSRRQLGMGAAVAVAAATKMAVPSAAAAAAPPPPKPFCGVSEIIPAWAYTTPWQEDLVPFGGYKTWYRDVNNSSNIGGLLGSLQRRYTVVEGKLPVLVIPGGPGLSSSYMASLELMCGVGRRVVFYDPIGTGNSFLASGRTGPPASDINLQLLVSELQALCEALKLGTSSSSTTSSSTGSKPNSSGGSSSSTGSSSSSSSKGGSNSSSRSSSSGGGGFHIYGQGTGGILALELAAALGSKGIASLTLASTPPSYSALIADRRACASALGGSAAQALLEREGETAESAVAEVGKALREYRKRHVCRTPGEGAGCVAAARRGRSRAMFEALCGGRLFAEAGGLVGWEAGAAVQRIGELPVLLSRGEYDEVSRGSVGALAGMLRGARPLVELAGSGAYQHIDAWEAHLVALEEFMSQAEGSTPATAAQ